jgi:Endonuclease I/Secretion system C-terminal sorting domain
MMKKLLLLLFTNFAFSQVYINELDSDTEGVDALEFIEFKSASPNFSLNGYVLVLFNEGTGVSYQSFDLDGMVTDTNGIVTLGSVGVSPAPDRIAPNNFIENGPDGIALYQLNTAPTNGKTPAEIVTLGGVLIDALIYETNDTGTASILMAAFGETVQYDEHISTAFPSTVNSIQRKNDGSYETKTPTPDVPNDGTGVFNYLRTTISPTGNQTEGNSFTINFTLDSNVTGSNLNFTYSLANGAFTTADYTGSLSVTIPVGTKTASKTISLTDDSVNEGDETMIISIETLVTGYTVFNNNIEVRIHDNDYTVQPWGTPINPTYGLCPKDIPTGYYNSLENKSGSQLKQAIQDIIANPSVVREHTYADVFEMLKDADQDPTNSSNVWLMYVERTSSKLDQQTGTSGAAGFWNREHIYPQSRGAFNLDTGLPNDGIDNWTTTDANDIEAGGTDGHHIRAEDSPENSLRSNRNYGVDYNGPSGTAGSWKGDVARAIFYMAVRYNGLNVVNGNVSESPTGNIGDLASLLVWNNQDKPDDFEMNHNKVVYNWQKNRNPFVDYPLLVEYVYGSRVGQTWNASLSNEDFNALNVSVYPNPSNGSFYISGLQQTSNIEVNSITGQLVYASTYENDTQLDLQLPKGVYLLKITEENKSVVKKIVIR